MDEPHGCQESEGAGQLPSRSMHDCKGAFMVAAIVGPSASSPNTMGLTVLATGGVEPSLGHVRTVLHKL